jgi:hypothetical protein
MSHARTSKNDNYRLAGQASGLERLQVQSHVWSRAGDGCCKGSGRPRQWSVPILSELLARTAGIFTFPPRPGQT